MYEKKIYTVAGRYMRGTSVDGYHIVSNIGSPKKVSKEQLIFICSNYNVTNCKCRMSATGVDLVGVGCNILQLPVCKVVEHKDILCQNAELDKVVHELILDDKHIQQVFFTSVVNEGNKCKLNLFTNDSNSDHIGTINFETSGDKIIALGCKQLGIKCLFNSTDAKFRAKLDLILSELEDISMDIRHIREV